MTQPEALEKAEPGKKKKRGLPSNIVNHHLVLTTYPPAVQAVAIGEMLTLRCGAKGSTGGVGKLSYTWLCIPAGTGSGSSSSVDGGSTEGNEGAGGDAVQELVRRRRREGLGLPITATNAECEALEDAGRWDHANGGKLMGREQELTLMRTAWEHAGDFVCIVEASRTPGQLLTPVCSVTVVTTEADALVVNKPVHDAERRSKRERHHYNKLQNEAMEKGLPMLKAGYVTVRKTYPISIRSHPQSQTVERLGRVLLKMRASGGDGEEDELDHRVGGGLLYTWLKAGEIVQGPSTAEQGGAAYEILHARPAMHQGWYVCMVSHRIGGRKERVISEPAELVVESPGEEPPPVLPHAPMEPMTPRGRQRRGLTPR